MGPRGFWIALVVVLFYVIARPHVGQVWHLTKDRGPTTPPPGFGDFPPGQPLPTMRFVDKRDCFNAEMRYESKTGVTGIYCIPENALLWGW